MADLPSTPADGNVKVVWVPTLTAPEAPTVAELSGGTVIDLSCYLTADGFTPGLDEQTIEDERLCDTETFEQPGRSSRTLEIVYIDNSNNTGLDNEALETLVPGTTGYFVVRRGKAYDDAFAAADKVDVWPLTAGQYSDQPPEANSVLKVGQKMFVTAKVRLRTAVAA